MIRWKAFLSSKIKTDELDKAEVMKNAKRFITLESKSEFICEDKEDRSS